MSDTPGWPPTTPGFVLVGVKLMDTTPELSDVNELDDMRGFVGRGGRFRSPSEEHSRLILS
jgi:hypothetical protein